MLAIGDPGGLRVVAYIKEKNKIFFQELLYPRHFRILIIIYITLKITSNLFYGDSYFTGIKSGIVGILVYWLGMYTINLASESNDDLQKRRMVTANKKNYKQEAAAAKRGLLISLLYTLFLLIFVVDSLQRINIITGYPLFSYVLGYDSFLSFLEQLSLNISNAFDFISSYQVENIILAGLFYVLIPYVLFRLLGYTFKGQFFLRGSQAALPIFVPVVILFIKNGLEENWVWNLVYTVFYPALSEAFFHRGIVYRSAASAVKNPSTALVMGAAVYCMLYFPYLYFWICAGSINLCLSKMGDVFLHGLLMAYAYRKTGTLLPWILIHALSNPINFL